MSPYSGSQADGTVAILNVSCGYDNNKDHSEEAHAGI